MLFELSAEDRVHVLIPLTPSLKTLDQLLLEGCLVTHQIVQIRIRIVLLVLLVDYLDIDRLMLDGVLRLQGGLGGLLLL